MRTGSIDVGLIVCSNNVFLSYDNGISVHLTMIPQCNMWNRTLFLH